MNILKTEKKLKELKHGFILEYNSAIGGKITVKCLELKEDYLTFRD